MTISALMNVSLLTTVYTETIILYDALTGMNLTSKKRLSIDLTMICQAYELQEIFEDAWIQSASSPADAMIKDTPSAALKSLMGSNMLSIVANLLVERKD